MPDLTRPFLVLYVLWHPAYAAGAQLAQTIFEHYRRELYSNVAGGAGISVIYRSASVPGSGVPLPVALDEAEATAVVALLDENLASDPTWTAYVREVASQTNAAGLATRLFPVAVEPNLLQRVGVAEQALRWDQWDGEFRVRSRRLLTELTYEFCRMLRHWFAKLKHPEEGEAALEQYLKKVQVFLSHSKHDPGEHGVQIARAIRARLHQGHGYSSFFDVHDIPGGVRFNEVILHQVRNSAVVAIHTDTYSSREWCRIEVIEAKRHNVPLVVANSIKHMDERGFPYLGNVPVVRLEPGNDDRIDFVVGRLMDEVLKDFLWKCQITLADTSDPAVVFIPRPPELLALATLPPQDKVAAPLLVYPDPPLSREEERLFHDIAPHVQLRSRTEWLAGASR